MAAPPFSEAVVGSLAAVVERLPGGGEHRSGQVAMAEAVARAIEQQRHLVVQAGTGTGKSLAYLVPAVLSGQKVVVATATKGLQDQLALWDLPLLREHLDPELRFSVLKGRSNYICLQRVDEVTTEEDQLGLDLHEERAPEQEVASLVAWSRSTSSGDRAELDFEPSPQAWTALSVGVRECPGAQRCPRGEDCFAEHARRRAEAATLVVVNTHLLGLDLATGGAVLPEHDVVVIDEAHELEAVISATSGVEISTGRFRSLARSLASIVAEPELGDALGSSGAELVSELGELAGRRLTLPGERRMQEVLVQARHRVERALGTIRSVPRDGPANVAARRERALVAATSLIEDLDSALEVPETHVAWVDGSREAPILRLTPIDVSGVLRERLWSQRVAILTSATIPIGLGTTVGLEEAEHDQIDVGSPFDFERNALLYCAAHLPDPRSQRYEEALHAELEALITAAGGATLALFTSWRAMDSAAATLSSRLDVRVLTQRDLPRPALLAAFKSDRSCCLFATMGFWQGVDLPGSTLTLVTIDRLPFPRPDDPVLQARRERVGAAAFRRIDLPRAATLLAQGAGRLIRTGSDRGVVAVLDPRLATSSRYRWELIHALPPMRRTKELAEAVALLSELREAGGQPAPPSPLGLRSSQQTTGGAG